MKKAIFLLAIATASNAETNQYGYEIGAKADIKPVYQSFDPKGGGHGTNNGGGWTGNGGHVGNNGGGWTSGGTGGPGGLHSAPIGTLNNGGVGVSPGGVVAGVSRGGVVAGVASGGVVQGGQGGNIARGAVTNNVSTGVNMNYPRQTPFAYSPGMATSFSQQNCVNSVSLGVSAPFGAIGGGVPIESDECNRRADSIRWQEMQLAPVACHRMLIDSDPNIAALKASGLTCNQAASIAPAMATNVPVPVATPALDDYDRRKRDEMFKEKMGK